MLFRSGPRQGRSPLFWPGDWGRERLTSADPALSGEPGQRELARRFLALYGPATEGEFATFLGCCPRQGRRLWALAEEVGEPVTFLGHRALALAEGGCPSTPRGVQLLPPYDPYLYGGRRWLCEEGLEGQLWKTVGNPGALLRDGVAVGWWRGKTVMEPIITESLFESLTWLKNAIETLTSECILGITVNLSLIHI